MDCSRGLEAQFCLCPAVYGVLIRGPSLQVSSGVISGTEAKTTLFFPAETQLLLPTHAPMHTQTCTHIGIHPVNMHTYTCEHSTWAYTRASVGMIHAYIHISSMSTLTYIDTCSFTLTKIHAGTHRHINSHITHTCTHLQRHMLSHICMHTYTCTNICINSPTPAQTHANMHVHANMYTHTHTLEHCSYMKTYHSTHLKHEHIPAWKYPHMYWHDTHAHTPTSPLVHKLHRHPPKYAHSLVTQGMFVHSTHTLLHICAHNT